MNISSIQVTLYIGKLVPVPAPAAVMSALQSIEITQDETSGFQMSFLLQRSPGLNADYALLSGQLLQPGNRVIITVTLSATPRVLMDGIITHQQFAPDNGGGMTLSVTGEDISVMMDMHEIPMEYPGMGDAEIALFVLAKYAAFGIIPLVFPPLTGNVPLPVEYVPQQSGTDRAYLKSLASAHGYVFFVKPGLVPLQNFAYWGPVARIGLPPQKALTVDAGPETNVESLSFSYDALAPVQVYGAVSDEIAETVLPVVTFASTQLPPLASQPPLIFNQPFVKTQMLDYQGSSFLEAYALAQAITDQSLDSVVTVDGSLDVLRYGDILMAPGMVGVRGVGFTYDGYYMVRRVTHQISPGQYKQSFSLSREGTGSTAMSV